MISTGTLMLGKALLTATAVLGFCIWQLHSLRRLRRERERKDRDTSHATELTGADSAPDGGADRTSHHG